MVDLEPFNLAMKKNMILIILIGIGIIVGTLFFKKLDKIINGNRRRRRW